MTNKNELDELAREERNAYFRQWRSKNRDKIKEYNASYWKRQAEKSLREKMED